MPAKKTVAAETTSSKTAKTVTRRRAAPKKETAPAEAPAPAPAPAPAVEPVVAATSDVDDVQDLLTRLTTELEEFRRIKNTLSDLSREIVTRYEGISKTATRVLKRLNKRRRTKGSSDRKPSGFQSPIQITGELCSFLQCEPGSKVSRMEVTRQINKYIKENNLQDPADKRNINADEKLRALLRIDSSDNLTYFNLQSKMNHLFIKATEQTA